MVSARDISVTPQDWVEIQQLWSTYARYSDSPNPEGYRELFTPDGSWKSRSGSLPPQTFVGLDAVVEGLGANARGTQNGDPNMAYPTMHLMSNPLISVTGDTARGNWYLTSFRLTVPGDESPVKTGGRYEVQFKRIDGVWWIHDVELTMYWTVGVGSVR